MNRRRMKPAPPSCIRLTTVGGTSDPLLLPSADQPHPSGQCVPEPGMPRLSSTSLLSILSLFLHSALVAIHIALLVVWYRRSEHRVVFAVESEPFISRGIKVVSTMFGTIYSALLVFVTQKLVLRRNFRRSQLLTTTHDSGVAWTGLGSALVCVWQQKAIPASISGVLSAFVYLANILVLHVTFPGLLAVDSVFLNSSVSVTTQSLPVFNFSGYDLSNQSGRLNAMSSAGQNAMGSLASFPFLSMDDTEGLQGGTLYDVWPKNTAATGLASVNATGFNISCGYLSILTVGLDFPCPCFYLNGSGYSLVYTSPDVVAPLRYGVGDDTFGPLVFPTPSIFYSSVPILDSNNQTVPWVNLSSSSSHPLPGPPAIQPFRCSLSLVQQTAILNSTTRKLVSLELAINKTTSTWRPFSGGVDDLSNIAFANPQGFLNIWESWYSGMPTAVPPPQLPSTLVSVGDIALLQGLNLFPFNRTLKSTIYLHELENQLANIVASMFWTLGHVRPLPGYNPLNLTTNSSLLEVSLLAGNAIVEETILQGRLNLSIIAIIGGLLASMVLMALTVQFLSFAKTTHSDVQPEGVNMLHSIWLYRNHPELHARLRQVVYPTDVELREAGMVRTKLIAPSMNAIGSEDFDEWNAKSHDSENGPKSRMYLLPSSQKAPKTSVQNSHRNLSLVSAVLHSSLVAIYLALVVIAQIKLEHEITFPLTQQLVVSWAITTIATTFVTIYLAGLLFLTQTLAFRRSLHKVQMITATHDDIAAWDGIGSALVHIWYQKAVPASVLGVLSAFVYLAGVLVLHIASPALLSVQPLSLNYSAPITTHSLPTFTLSGYDPASLDSRIDALHSPLLYAQGSLAFLPFLNLTAPLGLHGATLYDVLELNSGVGNVTVDATRFDMTCGYVEDSVVNVTVASIEILGKLYVPSINDVCISTLYQIVSSPENMSSALPAFTGSALFYSTIPILDANGDSGPLVNVTGLGNASSVTGVQIFRCSAKPAKPKVIVDSQSCKPIYIDQEINNDHSIWGPVDGNSDNSMGPELDNSTESNSGPEQTLADNWESWYPAMPASTTSNYAMDLDLTVADMFFVEQLSLPVNSTGRPNITLREFENTLSALVASMYWTLGHITPLPGFTPASLTVNGPPPLEVSLLQGTAEVTETNVKALLDLSTTAITGDILASTVLLLVSLQFLDLRKSREHDADVAISGMGLLHAIWLYREHPELEKLLEQVVEPTDENLRRAGMVRMRLAGSGFGKRRRRKPELEAEEEEEAD
ncbi:hypothetical protein C8R45DRAFT_1031032 [Mycena sanguinolenta]|nr:hypothetical protein C8R45DRAFT_1031032 [Mycena sanguinolenta]